MNRQDPPLEIVEGIAGVWHYHLRRVGKWETLCGRKDVMKTAIPVKHWGQKGGHIPSSYCKTCTEKATP